MIDPRATIGEDVRIGPFAVIEQDVAIGATTAIGPHACIHQFTTIGAGCQIHAGAVLGDVPQDIAFDGQPSELRVGAGCTVREGVTIHRGTTEGSATEIGEGCYLMAHAHCAHNVVLGREVTLASGALLAGHVTVGDRAFISGNCLVHQFVKIGSLAMLGGGCAVSQDVPPYCLVAPVSLNRVVALNVVGLRRAGVPADRRAALSRAFKLLYRSGAPVGEAVRKIRAVDEGCLEVATLCDFVERSQRGIVRG